MESREEDNIEKVRWWEWGEWMEKDEGHQKKETQCQIKGDEVKKNWL